MPIIEHEEISFTREQFYAQLWSTPATRIATELGVSDVMICKICKSHNIPKPYLGYWAKLEHGKTPSQTPLPKNDDPALQMLTFRKHPERKVLIGQPAPEPVYDPDIQEMLDRARALPAVKVADTLRNPHPLVAATLDRIRRSRIPFHQRPAIERADTRPTLCVSVTRDTTSRALRIMDALVKRIETIGGRVEVRNERGRSYRKETVVFFGGEEVSAIRLRETEKRVRVPANKKKYRYDPDTKLQASGLLVMDQGPSYCDRILLRDTPKRRRIEDGLNDLIIGFVKQVGDLRIRRCEEAAARQLQQAENRIRRQQEEELRQRREELKQRQDAERARVDELIENANTLRQSRIIREYIEAARAMLLERDGGIAGEGKIAEYLLWAEAQADRLDPLRPCPPSVLDERI